MEIWWSTMKKCMLSPKLGLSDIEWLYIAICGYMWLYVAIHPTLFGDVLDMQAWMPCTNFRTLRNRVGALVSRSLESWVDVGSFVPTYGHVCIYWLHTAVLKNTSLGDEGPSFWGILPVKDLGAIHCNTNSLHKNHCFALFAAWKLLLPPCPT